MPQNTPQTLKGRILTRHLAQRDEGLCLQYYLATEQGPVLVEVPGQEQVCFAKEQDAAVLCQGLSQVRAQPLALRNFAKEKVAALYSRSRQQMRLLQKQAQDQGMPLYEADLKPQQRFLIERFIALDAEFYGYFSEESGALRRFVASRARKASLNNIGLAVISLDLECSMQGELYSAGLYGRDREGELFQRVYMIGQAQDGPDYIHWVWDEAALLQALVDWFSIWDPDIIIGWSVVNFDLALLSRRYAHHGIEARLGRAGMPMSWLVEGKYRPETLSLPGRVVLDGIDWLKAAFYQFERYSLEFVSRALLSEGKAIDKVEDRGQEISHLFQEDKLALAHYNLTDCRLVLDIFDKTDLLNFALARAQLTGLEFGRVGASVAAFNHLYLPHLHRGGFVAPAAPASDGLESPGGYVMDSIPGLYRDILVLDFKSLYPSIIRTFLIDPMGLVQGMGEPEVETVPGFLSARFSRKQPILPTLIAKLAQERESAKAQANAPLSQAIKIIMNSLYGVLGSRGCVFHDARLASSITMRGHEIMQQTKRWIEDEGMSVIYGDTDSTFVWLGQQHDITDPQAFGRELAARITAKWQQHLAEHFQLQSHLELEFERHYEQFLMPTLRDSEEGSKKRYVGASRNSQGQLDIIFKGMEQVRSDWSPLARRVQYELYRRMFNGLDVVGFLATEIEALKRGDYDSELVFSKRLRRKLDAYQAKASPHVKAARQLLEQTGDPRYGRLGTRIDYLVTINGPEAVSLRRSAIDYDYYIERQIKPIADPILSIMKESFTSISTGQMSLI
ncbi:DNA polymerase II [Shewanella algae]|uniref:DNA polymerase II n=1 Tax=Shewanella algae TaxID=38313 RepID=UPI00165667BA|nr:DNA polymerase II [Shewanella algae]MBC8797268.1 DNA polymerase II [Shewanella algae]